MLYIDNFARGGGIISQYIFPFLCLLKSGNGNLRTLVYKLTGGQR